MQPALAPPYDKFLATAEAVALERPEVDPEIVREVFLEVATLLYNSLALDHLDEHDTDATVDALCVDLVAADPGAAIRARAERVLADPGEFHDGEGVAGALVFAAALMKL
jgi:hypothetical protein